MTGFQILMYVVRTETNKESDSTVRIFLYLRRHYVRIDIDGMYLQKLKVVILVGFVSSSVFLHSFAFELFAEICVRSCSRIPTRNKHN